MTENYDLSELNIFEKDYYADNFIIKINELRLSNESIFLLQIFGQSNQILVN